MRSLQRVNNAFQQAKVNTENSRTPGIRIQPPFLCPPHPSILYPSLQRRPSGTRTLKITDDSNRQITNLAGPAYSCQSLLSDRRREPRPQDVFRDYFQRVISRQVAGVGSDGGLVFKMWAPGGLCHRSTVTIFTTHGLVMSTGTSKATQARVQ